MPAADLAAAASVLDLAHEMVGSGLQRLAAAGGPDAAQVLAYDLAHAASALDPAMPWDVVICRSFAGRSTFAEPTVDEPDAVYIRGVVARMFAKATHGIALLNVPEKAHQALLHALAEVGAKAIQIEGLNLFARV